MFVGNCKKKENRKLVVHKHDKTEFSFLIGHFFQLENQSNYQIKSGKSCLPFHSIDRSEIRRVVLMVAEIDYSQIRYLMKMPIKRAKIRRLLFAKQ